MENVTSSRCERFAETCHWEANNTVPTTIIIALVICGLGLLAYVQRLGRSAWTASWSSASSSSD